VGLPFFVLSAASPLTQAWYAKFHPGNSPYYLYALSNAGALLGLLSYPLVFELILTVRQQATVWTIGFLLFTVLLAAAAWWVWSLERGRDPSAQQSDLQSDSQSDSTSWRVPLARTPVWAGWAAVGVVLYMSVTNWLCEDIAAIPMLWVLPLSVYLLTYILTFSGVHWLTPRFSAVGFALGLVVLYVARTGGVATGGHTWFVLPLLGQVGLFLVAMFLFGLGCHAELYRSRPESQYLTVYYLAIASGGVLGGIFVNIVAPTIFLRFYELSICVLAACAMLVWSLSSPRNAAQRPSGYRLTWTVALLALLGSGALVGSDLLDRPENEIYAERNFFGILRVDRLDAASPEHDHLVLMYGATKHGAQYLTPDSRGMPTTYYSFQTGGGLAILAFRQLVTETVSLRIGVVGLGVGTLASYGQVEDYFRFYEINPAVVEIAAMEFDENDPNLRFSYLAECPAEWDIVLGDARLKLEEELEADLNGMGFDVLVLDAFNSGAIPVHLLTSEAFEIYSRHLNPEGVMAVHISSDFFDLRPVVYKIAAELGFSTICISNRSRTYADKFSLNCDVSLISTWVILYKNLDYLRELRDLCLPLMETGEITVQSGRDLDVRHFHTWTDDYSNLFQLLVGRI